MLLPCSIHGLESHSWCLRHCLVDSDVVAEETRASIVEHSRLWLRGLADHELARVSMQIEAELMDDPTWGEQNLVFTWERFHQHLAQPTVFATNYSIACFARWQGLRVEIYQETPEASIRRVHEEVPAVVRPGGPVQLLRDGLHYDLLVEQSAQLHKPKRRMTGKQNSLPKKDVRWHVSSGSPTRGVSEQARHASITDPRSYKSRTAPKHTYIKTNR